MSAADASYSFSLYTSGARYGSEPTMPGFLSGSVLREIHFGQLTLGSNHVRLKRIPEDMGAPEINNLHDALVANNHIVQLEIAVRET